METNFFLFSLKEFNKPLLLYKTIFKKDLILININITIVKIIRQVGDLT